MMFVQATSDPLEKPAKAVRVERYDEIVLLISLHTHGEFPLQTAILGETSFNKSKCLAGVSVPAPERHCRH
jgi:hypothetical protein